MDEWKSRRELCEELGRVKAERDEGWRQCNSIHAMLGQLRERNAYLQAQLDGDTVTGPWRDIKTAPRDRPVLLWFGNFDREYAIAQWFEPWGCWMRPGEEPDDPENEGRYGIGTFLPTHWMPLPPAPDEARPADKPQPKSTKETSWGCAASTPSGDEASVTITAGTYDLTEELQPEPDETSPDFDEVNTAYKGLICATYLAHKTARDACWYHDPATGEPRERNFAEVVALMHSELSEALEAHRKGLMDDKLPHRDGREVELADCIIRILDTAGALGLDVAGAFIEKNRYNQTREDHKLENRAAAGGKKI